MHKHVRLIFKTNNVKLISQNIHMERFIKYYLSAFKEKLSLIEQSHSVITVERTSKANY